MGQYIYSNRRSSIEKRQKLRIDQTKAEYILWKHLRNKQLGVKFRRQFNIGNYIVDFYCRDLQLVIEVDGWIHGEDEQHKKDIVRQNILEQEGYTILRFRNEQIKYELSSVLQCIWNVVKGSR